LALKQLKDLIGSIPASEAGFKKRMRIHQGWWRAFVLGEQQGNHPVLKGETVCNTICGGEASNKNFLSGRVAGIVHETVAQRKEVDSGIIEEDRLFNDLLSSQPLCFNFFGELKADTNFALTILNGLGFELTAVRNVIFEYAPSKNYTTDNSVFDVAIEVERDNKKGLIGMECKYTDSFSSMEYDKPAYRSIFQNSGVFHAGYNEYKSSKYNQLFRNQLIAEALIQNNHYDFTITGLFCHKDDKAVETGKDFQNLLKEKVFKVITYQDFITAIQKSEITWQQREFSMLLWARYCGVALSKEAYEICDDI
jgi:hypothetical protein